MSDTSIVRLAPGIRRALHRKHGKAIKEHGQSYVVNLLLAAPLGAEAPKTPTERMSRASRLRWRRDKAEAQAKPAKRVKRQTKGKGEATHE